MKINIKKLKELCSSLLSVVSSDDLLEIKCDGKLFSLTITDKEKTLVGDVYVDQKLTNNTLDEVITNASLFLKFINSIDNIDDCIDITHEKNALKIKYKNKIKYRLYLESVDPVNINIMNPTSEFKISSKILKDILVFNSKELEKTDFIVQPIQTMYYIDEEGCITFTDGACINNFTLDTPVRICLNKNIVKLFKLFNEETVSVTIGYDAITESLLQTKICLYDSRFKLTAITGYNDTLLAQIPVKAIRGLANKYFENSVVVNKNNLIQSFKRLLLFVTNRSEIDKAIAQFTINKDEIKVSYKNNEDILNTENGSVINDEYSFLASIKEIKDVLDTCNEQFVTINYGNHKAIVLVHNGGNIRNVIPEVGE